MELTAFVLQESDLTLAIPTDQTCVQSLGSLAHSAANSAEGAQPVLSPLGEEHAQLISTCKLNWKQNSKGRAQERATVETVAIFLYTPCLDPKLHESPCQAGCLLTKPVTGTFFWARGTSRRQASWNTAGKLHCQGQRKCSCF